MVEAGAGWTEDRVQLLGKLWGEGLSASQIAAVLGGGVTRNAVIGKVHRLGLAGRPRNGQPDTPRAPKTRAAVPPVGVADRNRQLPRPPAMSDGEATDAATVRLDDAAIPVSQRVSILELRDSMCRWPLGDPSSADFGFCGRRAETGLPYCGQHCRIAYQPAAERRRLRA